MAEPTDDEDWLAREFAAQVMELVVQRSGESLHDTIKDTLNYQAGVALERLEGEFHRILSQAKMEAHELQALGARQDRIELAIQNLDQKTQTSLNELYIKLDHGLKSRSGEAVTAVENHIDISNRALALRLEGAMRLGVTPSSSFQADIRSSTRDEAIDSRIMQTDTPPPFRLELDGRWMLVICVVVGMISVGGNWWVVNSLRDFPVAARYAVPPSGVSMKLHSEPTTASRAVDPAPVASDVAGASDSSKVPEDHALRRLGEIEFVGSGCHLENTVAKCLSVLNNLQELAVFGTLNGLVQFFNGPANEAAKRSVAAGLLQASARLLAPDHGKGKVIVDGRWGSSSAKAVGSIECAAIVSRLDKDSKTSELAAAVQLVLSQCASRLK